MLARDKVVLRPGVFSSTASRWGTGSGVPAGARRQEDVVAIQEKEITIIPVIEEEYDAFEEKAAQMRSGELAELAFTAFRLREGVYGQRQAGVQMMRIKAPG